MMSACNLSGAGHKIRVAQATPPAGAIFVWGSWRQLGRIGAMMSGFETTRMIRSHARLTQCS